MSPDDIDDHAVGLIASRVAMALREELEALALRLGKTNGNESPLTVDDVAERLGVARSTVYAHWREWGATSSVKERRPQIRFSANALPTHTGTSARSQRDGNGSDTTRRRSRDRRRPLLRGAPRLPVSLGDDG